jgi:hypothetical protein
MIRLEDIKTKVVKFIREEFPEISSDVEEAHLSEEIAHILYDMLVGDYQQGADEAEGIETRFKGEDDE